MQFVLFLQFTGNTENSMQSHILSTKISVFAYAVGINLTSWGLNDDVLS